jgi:vacuolar-type H+-ATPase subunit C/Vma6
MTRSSRRVYLLAKVYGRVAHSFLGSSFRDLLRLKSLADLHAALWPGPVAEGQAAPTVDDLESRVTESVVREILSILESLGEPEEILVHLARRFELQTLRLTLRGVQTGSFDPSAAIPLGRWASLRLDDSRDAEKSLLASPYAWSVAALASRPVAMVENEADRRYFGELVRLAQALPAPDRLGVLRYVLLEVALVNAVWALRLRVTYGMDAAAARPLMVPGMGAVTGRAVFEAFEIPLDSAEEWRRWRFGWLLEDQLADQFRQPDPVGAEARASQRLFVRAHQLLHQFPGSVCPYVAYIALKQQEAAMLRTAIETVSLRIPEKDALTLAGLRERVTT